jgi:putative drug exporter of the RND superfamily
MSHALYRWGRFGARRPWSVLAVWLVVSVAVIGASGSVGRDLEDTFAVPGLDSQEAVDLLSEANADTAGLTAQVVATPLDDDTTFFDSADARAELAEVQGAAAALPDVLGTGDPTGALAEGVDAAVASGTVSPDGRVALVRVQYPVLEEVDRGALDDLHDLGSAARDGRHLQVEMGGDIFFAFEEAGTGVAEMIGLVVAVVVLLVAFGSVIAMGLPIGMAILGLAIGVSSLSLVTHLVEIPAWATDLGAMVGLGVGIDYALLLVTRFREFRGRGMTVEESVGRAVATAGQAVVFAGGTVVVAILGLAVAGVPFVTAGGVAVSLIVLVMVIASVTLLPAFLGLAGHRLDARASRRGRAAVTVPGTGGPTGSAPAGPQPGSSGWERWGAHVATHAWAYTIGVTVLLLALTAPVLALRLGFPDEGSLPDSRTERRAYDLVADGFGPGVSGPLVVAVDVAGDPAVLGPLVAAIESDDGIASVAPPELDAAAGVATVLAVPTTSPQDGATLETVERLRAEVLPSVLDASPARAHVGGNTAAWGDLGDRIADRLPLFVAAVVLMSFVLLVVVFRSILVPLKAAVLNLLSIGAAYGVMVMVFQWGWGMGLVGLESTVPVIPFIPLFMFAIVFGLSMDYEVFLLSRVREEYLATGDNDASVVRGIAGTARVITSAALIMISVFAGFGLGDDPAIKMFGLGLATAILVDATVVRMVLVPAMMNLMGDANWWFPAWLDRLLPALQIDGEVGLPAPEMAVDHAPVGVAVPDVDPADPATAPAMVSAADPAGDRAGDAGGALV